MNIYTKLDENLTEIEVEIKAPKIDENISNIIKALESLETINFKDLIVKDEANNVYFMEYNQINKIMAEDSKTYVYVNNKRFVIKYRLYQLEELLVPKGFIRISNYLIVNKKFIECFDIGTLREIKVKFKDGTCDFVSKRRIKEIMKILKK